MNEKLQGELSEYIKATVDMASEQMPLVAEEIVLFAIWDGSIGLLLGIAMIPALVMWARHAIKERWDEIFWLGVCVGSLLSFFMIIFSLNELLKAAFAPRVLILEKLSGLL